jgi:hypothetical protein
MQRQGPSVDEHGSIRAAPLTPNFSRTNIREIKDAAPVDVPMFRYTHLRGAPPTFTAEDALGSKFSKNPKEVIYVAYVVKPEAYEALSQALSLLLPEIPLQSHFHMTLGFYGRVKPNIDLGRLPDTLNGTISQVLATRDNGLAVAAVELHPKDVETLERLGVQLKDKHLHFTLGTQLDYKPFESNKVLEVWKGAEEEEEEDAQWWN